MLTITYLPAFKDNYIWVFNGMSAHTVWVVDPGDAAPVIKKLHDDHLVLEGILLTHHHPDHSGGIAALLNYAGDIPVYGSSHSVVREVNRHLKHGDTLTCGITNFTVLAIPGHTLDHIAYYSAGILFCGDTLFSAGCGRIFEGTASQMYDSLQKIVALPATTDIYCGHEYTLNNLMFARQVEPSNHAIATKIEQITLMRQLSKCTLPANLASEQQLNPFLRCTIPEVITAVQQYSGMVLHTPVEVFANLREWKNNQ